MIYIDPPYNTGNEFIYPDKYADNLETYLKYTGQVDDAGFKLTPNAETSGRYHTNWLNMMYPRLKLARNVLRDDGVILISIDDHEAHHLRELCNEIFGEEHFLGCITWKRRQVPDNRNLNGVSTDHEYVLAYTRSTGRFLGEEKDLSKYANPDNDPRGPWMSDNLTGLASQDQRPNLHYDIVNPETGISYPPHPGRGWAYEPKRMKSLIQEQRILWPKQPTGRPRLKRFLNELSENTTGFSTVQNPGFTTDGTREVTALLDFKAFDFPKPVRLLTDLISQICSFNTGDIILDFFAGSGTTGHAALQLNSSDSGNRRFILVQLPEPCSEESEAFKRGFKTIAQIGEERIRRVIAEISKEESQESGNGLEQPSLTMTHGLRLDHGMRIFKLDASNIKRWDVDFDNLHAELLDAVENIKVDRSESDVLYELLLKVGLDLATAIEERQIDGKAVFIVGTGALVVCLARSVTLELVEGVAALKKELQPEVMRVVFRDSGFEDDVVKTNAVQILRQAGIEDIKSL
jgi:adenine-specific DNA-methyltransferase